MTVYIDILLKLLEMVLENSRKEISCELLSICTLVYVNKNFSYEGSLYFYITGYISHFYFCKHLDNATVKKSTNIYKTTFPYDMIFTKADASTSDEKVDKLTREFNIHHIAFIGSLIYLLSTIVGLSFAVHKLARFYQTLVKYIMNLWYIC